MLEVYIDGPDQTDDLLYEHTDVSSDRQNCVYFMANAYQSSKLFSMYQVLLVLCECLHVMIQPFLVLYVSNECFKDIVKHMNQLM